MRKLDEYVLDLYEKQGNSVFAELRNPGFYEPLFAFVGETIIAAKQGVWHMVHLPEFHVWEPWVTRSIGDQLLGYQLTHLCDLFVSPDPAAFSTEAAVEVMVKYPRIFRPGFDARDVCGPELARLVEAMRNGSQGGQTGASGQGGRDT